MSKVKSITVSNFKAIADLTADFKGCTAIITGANDKGKSTFLRGLFDRVKGIKPEIPLKNGEQNGFAEASFTDGSKLRWEFNNTTKAGEKLIYTTATNLKTPCSREICDRYFPSTFDVDKFLSETPMKQRRALQELVGLDFADIDTRYKEAFDNRTFANRKASEEKIKFDGLELVTKVEPVSLVELNTKKDAIRAALNTKYSENVAANNSLRTKWEGKKSAIDIEVNQKNEAMQMRRQRVSSCKDAFSVLHHAGCENLNPVKQWIAALDATVTENITPVYPPEPSYIEPRPDDKELVEIDTQITAAFETNKKADTYNNWVKAKNEYQQSQIDANAADEKVKAIEAERLALIRTAKMPDGFSFGEDGILFKGLPFTREQQSTSGLYIAALKLAAMTLGDVKTLHFDASFLDNDNLSKIQDWAKENDLQLLIERPDLDGGEIEYHIISE